MSSDVHRTRAVEMARRRRNRGIVRKRKPIARPTLGSFMAEETVA